MEGLDAIISRIMADAREEASELARTADKEIEELLKQNSAACEQVIRAARETGETQATAILSRAGSMAGLDRRKALLGARRELVEQALDLAFEKLTRLPDTDKLALYRRLINQTNLHEGVLVLNAADQPLAGQLTAEPGCRFSVADQPGSFAGGLIIVNGLIEENLTLETLFANKRAELVGLAAAALFETDAGGAAEPGKEQTGCL